MLCEYSVTQCRRSAPWSLYEYYLGRGYWINVCDVHERRVGDENERRARIAAGSSRINGVLNGVGDLLT